MKVNAVIFDMDGLMFDTERISAITWRVVEADYGFKVSEEFIKTIQGRNYEGVKQMFLLRYGMDLDFDEISRKRRLDFDQIVAEKGLPLMKGLEELLCYLKENGYKIAMATSSNQDRAVSNLNLSGLMEYFPVRISGDMVTHSKPDPEIFLQAAEALGEKPENCIVLEDSINGITGAIAGGFLPVMVPDLMVPDEEIRAKLVQECDSLLDVIDILENLSKKEI